MDRDRRKAGRPVNPDKKIMRKTLVQDDPEQMELLEDSGHTHAEAYRLGSRLLTKTLTPAGLNAEELKAKTEEARIESEAAAARYQALKGMSQEAKEEEERTIQARKDIEEAIETAARRLFERREAIRRGQQATSWAVDYCLEVLPPGSVSRTNTVDFIRKGKEIPDMDQITAFIKKHFE